MGLSLAFHIIFAAIGIGLFFLIVIAEGMYLRMHRRFISSWPSDGRGEVRFFSRSARSNDKATSGSKSDFETLMRILGQLSSGPEASYESLAQVKRSGLR